MSTETIMTISDKEKEILEKHQLDLVEYFDIYEIDVYDIAGTTMTIGIYRDNGGSLALQLFNWIDNFDMDEQIMYFRDDPYYRGMYTLKDCVDAYEEFNQTVYETVKELMQLYSLEGWYKKDLRMLNCDMHRLSEGWVTECQKTQLSL